MTGVVKTIGRNNFNMQNSGKGPLVQDALFPILTMGPVQNAANTSNDSGGEANVTTALLLAAGTGSRLTPLTKLAPKCLTEVGGIPILKRLVDNLRALGVNRLVVVVGHLKEQIREYLQLHATDMVVDYVFNPDYSTTNNIYSLWLARKQIREPFVMVESDLVFEPHMLKGLLKPDRMAISRMLPWMNGTTVEICSDERITAFRMSRTILKERKELDKAKQYKTVNLYSFSMDSWYKIDECLTRFVEKGMLGEYYEAAFAELVGEGKLSFKAVFFNEDLWYEIDTLKDLGEAEKLFSGSLSGGRSQKSSFPVVQPAA